MSYYIVNQHPDDDRSRRGRSGPRRSQHIPRAPLGLRARLGRSWAAATSVAWWLAAVLVTPVFVGVALVRVVIELVVAAILRSRELGRWVWETAIGEFLESVLQRAIPRSFAGSFVARLAPAVLAGISAGVIVQLVLAHASYANAAAWAAGTAVVAIVYGVGGGGFLFGLVLGLWGWLAVIIVDALTAETIEEPAVRRLGLLLGWMIAVAAGWAVGKALERAIISSRLPPGPTFEESYFALRDWFADVRATHRH